jgi:acyl transferase domain-containing protein
MFEMFKAQGVHAKAVMGHSAGEASAAYACGAYTLEEACYLVYHRSRLQSKLAGCGRMLVLMLDSSGVEDMLTRLGFAENVEVACFNSPSNTVVCGAEDVIMQLREKLEADGQPIGTLIPGDIAFHSRHMMIIKEELFDALAVLHHSVSWKTNTIFGNCTISHFPWSSSFPATL